ncbi:MAG: DUF4885 domain-containing protein [Lachnospiraceae bacterium]|nr:DUF4885 domain-containing protein [Lachnospiraceae bacterium]
MSSVGKGWYNYYHVSNRYDNPDGKAMTAWYERDLSTEEIKSNNSDIPNREIKNADICRKVAAKFEGVAAANRSKYGSVEEMKSAVWAKYSLGTAYKGLSHEEKTALARTEINMTMFGTVNDGEANIVAKLDGDFSKNSVGRSESESRAFNIKMLGIQIGNVLKNNGIALDELGDNRYWFSINGMTNSLSVSLFGDADGQEDLMQRIENALNTKDNAKQLFFNLLYDSNKRGLIPYSQHAKWKLFNDFKNITGKDISDFKQTDKGFVNSDGVDAKDVYKEALKTSNKVPEAFKGDAYDYFTNLESDALQYTIDEVPDLTLSLEYSNGGILMPGDRTSFDVSI